MLEHINISLVRFIIYAKKNISAKKEETRANTRLSFPNGNKGRAQCFKKASPKGAEEINRVEDASTRTAAV
jgi:hypothetical protein